MCFLTNFYSFDPHLLFWLLRIVDRDTIEQACRWLAQRATCSSVRSAHIRGNLDMLTMAKGVARSVHNAQLGLFPAHAAVRVLPTVKILIYAVSR